jgi:tetratricopeptide (TPR) repeat protein
VFKKNGPFPVMRIRKICFTFVFLLPLVAHGRFNPTEEELSLLPSYCRQKVGNPKGNDPNKVQHWYATFGKDYRHMHHYCEGLVSIIRGDKITGNTLLQKRDRKFKYRLAIQEFDATEGFYATPNFKLLPELYVKRGDAHGKLGDKVKQEIDYLNAYNKFPNYSVSYTKLVDLYLKQGRVEKAKSVNDAALEKFGKKKKFIRRAEKIKNAGDP